MKKNLLPNGPKRLERIFKPPKRHANRLQEAVLRNFFESEGLIVENKNRTLLLTDALIPFELIECKNLMNSEVFFLSAEPFETKELKIKRQLFEKYGEGKLHVFKGTPSTPVFCRTIIGEKQKIRTWEST